MASAKTAKTVQPTTTTTTSATSEVEQPLAVTLRPFIAQALPRLRRIGALTHPTVQACHRLAG